MFRLKLSGDSSGSGESRSPLLSCMKLHALHLNCLDSSRPIKSNRISFCSSASLLHYKKSESHGRTHLGKLDVFFDCGLYPNFVVWVLEIYSFNVLGAVDETQEICSYSACLQKATCLGRLLCVCGMGWVGLILSELLPNL